MKYVGKQKALAFAVMAMLAGGSAQAALLDLTASPLATTNASSFAKEIKFDDTATQNLVEIAGGTNFPIKFSFGPGGAGNDVYVRLTLSSGQWNTALVGSYAQAPAVTTTGSVSVDLTGSSADLLLASDVKASAYVSADDPKGLVVRITSPTIAMVAGDMVTVSFNQAPLTAGAPGALPGSTLNVIQSSAANKISGDVTLTKSLHATAFNANTNNEGTNKVTGKYVGFDGTVFANVAVDQVIAPAPVPAYPSSTYTIDVLKKSLEFIGNVGGKYTAELCSFEVKESSSLLLNGTSADATGDIEAVTAGSVIKVEGGFASLGGTLGRLYLTTAGCTAEVAGDTSGKVATDTATVKIAKTLTNTEATFAIDNKWAQNFVTAAPAGAPGIGGPVTLCFASNGTTPIEAGAVKISYVPVANTNYKTDPSYSLGTCSNLKKNGSTATVPMLLNPASTTPSYIRVTNPSGQDGNVNIYSIDDSGKRSATALTFMLGAGKSSGLISPQAIITATGVGPLAAGTKTVEVAGQANKLRLHVEAEFGEGHDGVYTTGTVIGTPGEPSQTAVIVRTYSISSDSTGFSEFQ